MTDEHARRTLLPARGRALTIAAVGWLVLLGMALWLHGTSASTGLDTAVRSWLFAHVGTGLQEASLVLTEPALTVGGCAAVAVGALVVSRWDVAALAVVGPLAGLLLESHVFKPLIDRRYGIAETLSHGAVKAGYAFPSGHQTGLTSLTTLLVIVLLGSGLRRRVKTTLTVVAALWTVLGMFGLVRNNYHYFTDTIGGVALGVALLLTVALLVDVVSARLSSPGDRDLSRTARAA